MSLTWRDENKCLTYFQNKQIVLYSDLDQSSKDCLQYIGGYIARKVDKELYSRQESETDSNSWIAARSNGNLVYPTDDLMDILLKCDEQFIVFHGNTLNTEKEWHASNILISMST